MASVVTGVVIKLYVKITTQCVYNDHKRMDFSPGFPVYINCELCKTCVHRCELMTEVTGLYHASFVRV